MTPHRTRVVMVTDTLHVGGAEQVSVDIANTLDRDTHEVHFCATRADGPLHDKLRDDVEVEVLGRSSAWDLHKMVAFGRYLAAHDIDVIHSHGRGTMRFVAACRAMGLVHARHVFHDHFGRLHVDRSAGRTLTIPLRAGVDFYLGVESRLCTWAVERVGLPAERVELVRSGVELQRFVDADPIDLHGELGLSPDTLVLLMVANFRPQKDHPTLFRAIAELPVAERDRLHVVICGSTTTDPGYYRSCVEMLERLGISRCVTALGVRSDTPALMAGADAGVFSSKNESGPLVILEYMAAALPFIATDTGEIAQAVRGLGAGALVAPRDSLELAVALSDLIGLPAEERRRIGQVGRQLVEERFDQRLVTQQIEAVYRRVLATPRRVGLLRSN